MNIQQVEWYGPSGGKETVSMVSESNGSSVVKIPSDKIDPFPLNTTMVFSIWWMYNGESVDVNVNVLGKEETATITHEWSRYI